MAIVSANMDTLFRQAQLTASTYLHEAAAIIDHLFGDGHAKKNPQLVAAFMTVCAQDLHTATLAKVIEHAAHIIRGDESSDE